jgi:hypothetical protein
MRRGRPTPAVQLTVNERETLDRWARPPHERAGRRPPGADSPGVCRRPAEYGRGAAPAAHETDGRQVAGALLGVAWPPWIAPGRATTGHGHSSTAGGKIKNLVPRFLIRPGGWGEASESWGLQWQRPAGGRCRRP